MLLSTTETSTLTFDQENAVERTNHPGHNHFLLPNKVVAITCKRARLENLGELPVDVLFEVNTLIQLDIHLPR